MEVKLSTILKHYNASISTKNFEEGWRHYSEAEILFAENEKVATKIRG
jgi:hypothetical protein